MKQDHLIEIIEDQTNRALWEAKNVIDCVPDELWNKKYCDMPCWKHIYHMLHSLDLWYMNPKDRRFQEPTIHEKDLNNLDIVSDKTLTRKEIDEQLLEYPTDCAYCRFTLILAQFRHLHSHMGMVMGFIIDDTGMWPRVLGLENPLPSAGYNKYL